MAVGIDHPRDDRRSSRIDDTHIPRKGAFVGRRTDPHNPAVADEDADPFPQGRSRAVCESCVAIHDGSIRGHRATGCVVGSRRVRSFRPRWSRDSNGEELGCISNGRTHPRQRGSAETRERFGGAGPFVRLSNCIHPREKPDATVIRRNMDAESGWEPRRGAFRVPKALAEGGGDSMSVEENLRVIEAAQKALNDRDLDRFEGLHLNSVIQRDPQNPQGIKGPKAIRASLGPFLKAFPDIRLVTETQFGAGDWVTQLGQMRGTNTGPLEIPGGPTIPATNKSVRMPVAMIAKLEGGKF
ncbi:MAG: ester cyclase, partial [Methanobacteriota archaeon]